MNLELTQRMKSDVGAYFMVEWRRVLPWMFEIDISIVYAVFILDRKFFT